MMGLGHMENGLVYGATNDDWDSMTEVMKKMMWPYSSSGGRVFWGIHWVLELITWVLIMVVLVAPGRYLWKKGDKVK